MAAAVATTPVGTVHATRARSLLEVVSCGLSSHKGGRTAHLLTGAASEAALQLEHGAADFVAHGSVALLVVNHLLLAKKATALGGGGGGVVSATCAERHGEGGFQLREWYRKIRVGCGCELWICLSEAGDAVLLLFR